MKSAFFISDVHLTNMASPQGEAMLSLVKKAQQEASLFVILGDLFDLWLGSGKYFQNEYSALIQELSDLKRTCRVIYFEGNHDIHLKNFWEKKLGFEVYDDPQDFEFNGLKIRAEHGDEINREDKGYLFLRWFLRTPPLKFLIETLPSKILSFVGNNASKASREYTATKDNRSLEIFRTYARNLHEKQGFDLLLVGHTHQADDFKFSTSRGAGRLINLGSWFDGPHYLRVSDKNSIEILTL